VPAYFRFYILVGLGEFDRAFEMLELAFQERSGYLGFVSGAPGLGDPMEAPIANDPRLRGIRRRVAQLRGSAPSG
jgi:hypothetical protein